MKKSICMIFAGLFVLTLNTMNVKAGAREEINYVMENKATERAILEKEFYPLIESEEDAKIYEFIYNENGEKVRTDTILNDGDCSRTLVTYDDLGRRSSVMSFHTSNPESYYKREYQYIGSSAIVTESDVYNDEVYYSNQYEIQFNENGMIKEIIALLPAYKEEYTLSYDGNGNVSQIYFVEYCLDGSVNYRWEEKMIYDERGNVTETTITEYSGNDSVTYTNYFENEYDSMGRLLTVSERDMYDDLVAKCVKYLYE